MKSLKDQLTKAGLVDKQTAKNTPKKKQPKKPKALRGLASETELRVQQAMLKKAENDRELNRLHQQERQKKALHGQIMQLINSSRLSRKEGDVAYHFSYMGKVKTLYVSDDQQKQLSRDRICIVRAGNENFELVPKAVATKISERAEGYVIQVGSDSSESSFNDQDDPYANYRIPDDLSW